VNEYCLWIFTKITEKYLVKNVLNDYPYILPLLVVFQGRMVFIPAALAVTVAADNQHIGALRQVF